MEMKKARKVLFVLSAASLVLPWFSYSPNIMRYCWASEFCVLFVIPMFLVWYCFFGRGPALCLSALGILGSLGNIGVLIYALGFWQQRHNIVGGFHPETGIHTAVAGFWISASLFGILLILVVIQAIRRITEKGGEIPCCS